MFTERDWFLLFGHPRKKVFILRPLALVRLRSLRVDPIFVRFLVTIVYYQEQLHKKLSVWLVKLVSNLSWGSPA